MQHKHYLNYGFLALVCLILFTACHDKKLPKDAAIMANLEVRIIGDWTDGSTDNACLQIREDSIYYVDEGKSYKYELHQDTIKINFTEGPSLGIISFNEDTLLISDEEGQNKFWHFKK
ncbi:MAG: hypothetical protein NTZ33_12685 [Bacteroidetes bacterium]|nr:hypothetical protein [Bacteroidota bacterium]